MRLNTTFLLLFLIVAIPLKGQQNLDEGRYVRLIKANTAEMYQNESRNIRRITGPAQFLHNNTLIICDTAIWDVKLNTVDAIGNVKIIQNNTSLSGDRIHYIADSSLAKVRGHIVELMDRDSNRLRTFYLDFNTKDSVAWFYDGGAMIDKDGNIIESNYGYYDSKIEKFKFLKNVEMMSDSLVLKSDSLAYYANENRAEFLGQTSIWQNDSYLRAGNGWYHREKELYNFEKSVYIIDPKTEVWAEKIFYNAPEGNAELSQNVQILDTVQSLIIFSDFARYSREPAFAKLYNNPSIAFYSIEDNKPDTLFIAADTMLYNSVPRYLADSATVAQSKKRYEQSKIDPIAAMRSKPVPPAGKPENKPENKPESLKISPDSIQGKTNSQKIVKDTINNARIKIIPDTLLIITDSLKLYTDSIQLVIDNKKLRKVEFLSNAFAMAKEDSLHYNQLKGTDIILHFKEGELSRVDAFGGINMYVFVAEDSVLTTMNHKECKTMTARIADQNLQQAHYIDNAKSVLYPLIDLEPSRKRLKGFTIRDSERPADRFAVCNRIIRKSERDQILTVLLPTFGQTSRFFKITPVIPEVIIKTREPKPLEEVKIEAEGVETEIVETEITA